MVSGSIYFFEMLHLLEERRSHPSAFSWILNHLISYQSLPTLGLHFVAQLVIQDAHPVLIDQLTNEIQVIQHIIQNKILYLNLVTKT